MIEVKPFGKSNRGYDLWLEPRQFEEARTNRKLLPVRRGERSTRYNTQFTLKVLNVPVAAVRVPLWTISRDTARDCGAVVVARPAAAAVLLRATAR